MMKWVARNGVKFTVPHPPLVIPDLFSKQVREKNKEQGTNHAAAMVSTLELCSPTDNDYDSGFDSEDYDSAEEEDLGAEDDAE